MNTHRHSPKARPDTIEMLKATPLPREIAAATPWAVQLPRHALWKLIALAYENELSSDAMIAGIRAAVTFEEQAKAGQVPCAVCFGEAGAPFLPTVTALDGWLHFYIICEQCEKRMKYAEGRP